MRLLLTHGYFLGEDEKERAIMKPYPPLGILYLCSHLRAKGFDVEVFDTTFASFEDLQARLVTGPPGMLGVYANLMTRRNAVRILRTARELGWRTVAGGPEPASYIEQYLAAGAEFVVMGEGEQTLEELLAAAGQGDENTFSRIDGLAFRSASGVAVRNGPRRQIADLDAQPWPARDSIDIDRYVSTWREYHGQGSVNLITARGCPYHCRWCSHQVFGKTHRRRKPAAVVDELQYIMDRYQPDVAWMADDVFTIHHGWLFEYAAEMKRRGLRIPFECISRADRINQRVAAAMAELGCFRVWIGSESGSQRVLDAMQRGVTVEQVQAAMMMCKYVGIQTGMFLMWGYEGEEHSDIEATVEHVKRSRPDVFLTTISYPIRGTPYFDQVAPRVVDVENWVDSSDRDFRIRGRHSRRYYQFADRLLRTEVDRARAAEMGCSSAELDAAVAAARAGMTSTSDEVEA